ncbi:PREDICTED: T-cell surface glycoprotein CD4 [Crocodylus porosus]|uniref:T-cell surface glycoprotein CD4 n=1 Tax=Crocodylus porosus TaxID=8502 RepID=UPI00093DD45C|nr:PREDICTED: T-cell surface glycoprotein CD4 [Crocodylus porosus]XP_019404455.1 PREDICTED: T-cell surface glycoprotein CD4 [Crocodylus porosus]
MEPPTVLMCRILAVLSVMKLGLKPPVAVGQTKVAGVVGQEVILPCSLTRQMTSVTWKFQKRTHTTRRQESQEDIVIKYHINVFKGKAPMANRSELITTNFSLKVQNLAPYDVGEYTCESGHRGDTVQLVVFGVTELTKYLLHDQVLFVSLQQYSPVQNKITVTWWDNKDMEVTSEQSQTDQYSLHKSGLRITDSGKWKCKINLQFKPFDLDIPFDVIVIGFKELERKILYAAVNTTVSFSYLLNLWEVKWTGSLKAHLDWKAKADDNYREIMNFSITNQELTSPKQIKRFGFQGVEKPFKQLNVTLSKVLFEDAGWYQFRVTFDFGHLKTAIHLVVMTVSATPTGPLSKGAEVTLHCQLSALPLQKGLLIWHRVNGTKEESKQVIHREVEVKARTAGLWRCSFVLENKTLISVDYMLEEAAEWIMYALTVAITVASVALLLFVSLCTFICTAWQRRKRRAERMVRVRQDLLQNRTCQCQHRLRIDYFEA